MKTMCLLHVFVCIFSALHNVGHLTTSDTPGTSLGQVPRDTPVTDDGDNVPLAIISQKGNF